MFIHDAISHMMKATGTTSAALSSSLGRDRNAVSTMISRGSQPRVDTLVKMASYMGYKVVLSNGDDIIEIELEK